MPEKLMSSITGILSGPAPPVAKAAPPPVVPEKLPPPVAKPAAPAANPFARAPSTTAAPVAATPVAK